VSRVGVAVVLLVSPLLLAAARDPAGDVAACDGTAPVAGGADIVAVDGLADELGTAAVWRVRFADPIAVPDPDGAPLRIDVLVRDPRLPTVSRGDERGMNRIVRWSDTSADAPTDVLWLPARGHTPFNPPLVTGRTVELRVPGRILLGEADNGTESVARTRWSVLVRDGKACDRLGSRPAFRLTETASPSAVAVSPSVGPGSDAGGTADDVRRPSPGGIAIIVGLILLVPAIAVAALLRRRAD
jgi:hypothetical protein